MIHETRERETRQLTWRAVTGHEVLEWRKIALNEGNKRDKGRRA